MGRPRECDESEVLGLALEAFWRRGYEATSMSDLMQATGLAKGSLYKGFGDKRALFLRTLDTYLAQGRSAYEQIDDGVRSAHAVLRDWLGHVVQLATDGTPRKGCFGVNCVVELGPHDEEVRERMRMQDRWLRRRLEQTVERGIEAGEFRAGLDPGDAARWIATVMGGLLVQGKLGTSRRTLAAMCDFALEAVVA